MAEKSEILKKMDEVDALMRERMEEHRFKQPSVHYDDTVMAIWRLRGEALKRARNRLQQAISEELSV